MKKQRAPRRRASQGKALPAAAAALAAILAMAGVILWLTAPPAPQGRIGGPFALVAEDGRAVTQASYPGKYLAVYFGYTHCADVCPATMANLTAALDRLGSAGARVQPLFITLDPRRDTPAVLSRFVAQFSPLLHGLTGSEAALRQVGAAYRVVSHVPAAGVDYAVDHSSVIYVMAPDGRFLAPVPADASEMVMARAIARLVG